MKQLLLLIFLMLMEALHAQHISTNAIPTLSQLPVNAIHRVFQDSEGYMWYGTVNGLCRDDGYRVQVFRSDFHTPSLLENNIIVCIAEDEDGKIWFGTDKGAYILYKTTYHIQPLDGEQLQGVMIHAMRATSNGMIWVSAGDRLLRYRQDGTLLQTYEILDDTGKLAHMNDVCESRQGDIWLTFGGCGIYHWNREEDTLQPWPTAGLKHRNMTQLIQDCNEDYFWVGTWGDGLLRFKPSATSPDSMYIYQPLPTDGERNVDGIILYLAQDDTFGYIWATTEHSLVAYRQSGNGLLEQLHIPEMVTDENQMLNEVIKDRLGNLWVSAFDRPSFIIQFQENASQHYPMESIARRVNGRTAVMALCEAGDGVMWVSQERKGVFLYDRNNDRERCYTDCKETDGLWLNPVKEMAATSLQGGVWVAPERSSIVYRLNRNGMEMKLVDEVQLGGKLTAADYICKVCEDVQQRLWIGTTRGLYRYDVKKGTMQTVSDSLGFVSDIQPIKQGGVWVSTTDKGLYRFPAEGEGQHYPFSPDFSTLSQTTDGLLWMGTEGGGIYLFNPHTEELTDYTQRCGLQGNRVNRVMCDMFNHLWIDTNQRIIEFNPRNNSFRTYDTGNEGLALWRLIPTSLCMGADGRLYFGGIPGICAFTPSNHLESEARQVRTVITNVTVAGQSLLFGRREGCDLHQGICLQPDDRNLEIEFSSLNHRVASKIRYAYQLEGVDREWMYTPVGENCAFYNQLAKGTYRFRVKATDENGLWSNEVTELTIRRLPAFYETWWAYLCYILLALGIIYYLLYLYLKRMERKNNELWEDSREMMKMRTYLDSKVNLPEPEFEQLDELLMEKAVRTVEANLTEPDFDVAALAEAMNMSRSTLTRKLKAITGHTPLDFIRHIKMKHARRMLQDPQRSVTEVAATLGYLNRKYFTSCFKEEFGETPSEFQKRQSEGNPS